MEELLKQKLQIPFIEDGDSVLSPSFTFQSVSDKTGVSGDGEEQEAVEAYQLDIFADTEKECKQFVKKTKEVLREIKAVAVNIGYSNEKNAKCYRATVNIEKIQEVEDSVS